jgi:GNAT superfamily N-acetyltransferase
MPGYTMRQYAGAADLRRMQDAVAAAHAHTWWRVGDVAWMARNSTHLELSALVRLWHDAGGAVAGWVWPAPGPKGSVEVFVAPRHRHPDLLDEMLATIQQVMLAVDEAGDPVSALTVLAAEGEAELRAALERDGYGLQTFTFDVNRRTLGGLATANLPSGYRLAGVDDDLVDRRVEAQRAAFAPSTLTREKYVRVRRTWPYRPELDRVVLDPSGDVVAFCTAWLDERNASGLLEPVGTRPDHQRRGLATAVCLDALAALRAAGATQAQVSCDSGSAGCATYRAAGFTQAECALGYRRRLHRNDR